MEALWEAVDTNWSDILKAFHHRQEHKMFDPAGVLIDCNRPMIESMVDAKMQRSSTFWYYMELLMHDASIRREGNSIYVSCGTPLPLTDGGAEEIQ